ncbi:MAG: ArgR family transcriptional regulator [Planctomycetota bacterium]
MSRERRHETIRRLLADGPMPSQEAILEGLSREGITATQATLSRDLRVLGAVKGPEGYELAAAATGVRSVSASGRVLEQHALAVSAAIGSVVIRTAPGSAGLVALELDRHPPAGVVGTIAGDDTILVALREGTSPCDAAERLCDLAGLPPGDAA